MYSHGRWRPGHGAQLMLHVSDCLQLVTAAHGPVKPVLTVYKQLR